ncbi:ketopantoate reductase family protein [Candidatus Magnetaquicoccus inordinatus]|uniref:ketopantoate reductase family protein n=1 Tax=Candidatus Magnetaquicoccus inordinatus TaxID=2496818 RepID=UPI00102C5F8E|nr:2-dehydropantoate 2-reductase [Candidatus Magnetaquicoccus inordinatus]
MHTSERPSAADSTLQPPHILVVGSGAVGGYYGAQLAKAGAIVSTVQRSDYALVQEQGIHIDGLEGQSHFRPAAVLRQVEPLEPAPDYIVVALKVLAEIDTAAIIAPAVAQKSVILLLQNGIECEQSIAEAFAQNEILSGLAFVCLSRTAPGRISHTCYGHLAIGRYPHGASAAAQQLAQLFTSVGTACTVSEQIGKERWKKLVWNAAFNPLSVLGRATTQEILENPATADLAARVMHEVCQIADAAGYPLPDDVVERNLAATRKMKPYKTSMLLDYLAGRPMEVEAILGNALRAAQRCSVEVPHLRALYGALSLLARAPS